MGWDGVWERAGDGWGYWTRKAMEDLRSHSDVTPMVAI